ncbi:hypothetical protein [Catenisphaera adipataccumulans]|jgi:hypothetical protein|uniref:Uncharacterized protein n=1 Tax=Catenisphaera adipataccumulans TaxID=700500 RepID=A0A7W8CX83_9FIRM|nr:hypothetical protein [Catenisphaera adipataccumulans]MBB5182074.1 hypothetical protein [Catenisphaera adipataccumulans]
MKYANHIDECEDGDYFEFMPGPYDGRTGNEDSLYLNVEIFDDLELKELITEIIPEFDSYGITTVVADEWKQLAARSEVFAEMQDWAADVYKQYDEMTLIGL